MGALQWFNKNKYSGLSEVLGAIKKELERLQPQDSQDIVWNKSATGISASIRRNGSGSETASEVEEGAPQKSKKYKGQFAVELLEGNKFRVYDAGAPESTVAGYTDIPTFRTSGIPVAIVPVPENRELYINFVYDEAAGAYTYSFAGETVPPLSTRLARLSQDGIVVQYYTSDNGLNYSRDYFL